MNNHKKYNLLAENTLSMIVGAIHQSPIQPYVIPAEIEARRKQYEYYRNKLLTFKRKI